MSEQVVIWALVSLAVAASIRGAAAAEASQPFRVSNLSPPVAVTGLPIWATVPDQLRFGLTSELANHYRLREQAGDYVILDGETLRVRAYLEQPFANGWSFSVDIPSTSWP